MCELGWFLHGQSHITRTPTPAPIHIASLGNLKPDEEPPEVVVELMLIEVVTRPILGSLL